MNINTKSLLKRLHVAVMLTPTYQLQHLVLEETHTQSQLGLLFCVCCGGGVLVMLTLRAMPLPDTPSPLFSLCPPAIFSTEDNYMPRIFLIQSFIFSFIFFICVLF